MLLRSAAAATLVASFAACSSSPAVRDCATDADCGAGNLCHQGACAANAPPIADLSAPAAPTTHRVIALTGTATDPEGRPASLRWSVRALDGGCAADLESTGRDTADAIFWCAGSYEVAAVPVDDLGAAGSPAVRQVRVTAATGAPIVTVGLPIAATHRCDAALPACQVLGATGSPTLGLAAAATDPGGAALTWEWTALLPEGAAANPSLTLTFGPDAAAPQPTVSISSAGGAIAGVYRFRVRARNPDGLVGQAYQELTVANAHPTWRLPKEPDVPHVFDGARYVAEGDVALGAEDPDGDPLRVTDVLAPAPQGGCTEKFAAGEGATIHARIVCQDPAALLPAEARRLSVTVADPNGGSAAFEIPLVVRNLPPVVAAPGAAGALLAVDHRVEPCILAQGPSCFVADGTDPFVVSDPEGDPLASYALSATVAAGNTVSRGVVQAEEPLRRFRFETPSGLPLAFRSVAGASDFFLSARVEDALGGASNAAVRLSIGNRPPVVKEAVPSASVAHTYDAAARRYVATADGALFEDPDGDPMQASGVALVTSPKCLTASLVGGRAVIGCALDWDYAVGGVPPLGAFAKTHPAAVDVSDGWAAVRSSTQITILDRAATVSALTMSVQACTCASAYPCWRYALSSKGIPLPVLLTDPDGDPAQLKAVVPGSTSQALPVTCLPGWCHPPIDTGGGAVAAGTVYAYTGVYGASPFVLDAVTASFRVTLACSSAGLCCTP